MSVKSWLSEVKETCFRHEARSARRQRRGAVSIAAAEVEILETRALPAVVLSSNLADWMSYVPDEAKLSELSIPGTHDTMTRALALPYVITQYKTLQQQLDDGVRALDIRLRHVIATNFGVFPPRNQEYLDCYHGTIRLFVNFDDVLAPVAKFLKAHPGETIVMRVVGDEQPPDKKVTNTFKQMVERYLKPYGDIVYRPGVNGNPDRNTIPTLAQARGKIVMLDQGWGGGGTEKDPISLPWSNVNLKDDFNESDVAKKYNDNIAFLNANDLSRDFSKFNMAFFSGSAGGKAPEHFADTANPNLTRELENPPADFYAGIVMLDFVGADNPFSLDVNEGELAGRIIDLNKQALILSPVEKGQAMDVGSNLALKANGGTAFAKDVLGGYAAHAIPHLNDGLYGNAKSWTGNSNGSFVGISLGATPASISSVAWGRDNTGVLKDRVLGQYKVQYTTVPNPNASTPLSAWKTIGYASPTSSPLRNRYEFAPVLATGIRLLINDTSDPAKRVAIDELEVYGTRLILQLSPLKLSEIGGTFSPDNLATSSTANAFAKNVIGNESAHAIAHLNDGIYGNGNSWIGNSAESFVGISFGTLLTQTVSSIAFGRDNKGVFTDRDLGQYTIQYTDVFSPNPATPDSAWKTIGSVVYSATDPQSPALRHRYDFAPVQATGIRILIGGDAADHVAIDELEVYAVPSSNVIVKGVENGPQVPDLQEFNVPENAAAGTVVGTVKATSPSTPTLKYSLSRNPDNAFAIDETTGEITVVNGATLDFETSNLFVVGVTVLEVFVDDGSGFGIPTGTPLSTTQNVTVRVTNVNESPVLNNVGGPVDFKSNLKKPVAVLPQIIVGDGDGSAGLGGGTLEITLDVFASAVGNRLKQFDLFDTGDASIIGRSFVPTFENGLLTVGFQLNQDVTAEAIQSFLQGITFKTSGKGLSTPTRTLTVTLTDVAGLPVTAQQTINVAKK